MKPFFTHGFKGDPGLHFLERPLGLALMVAYKGLWGMFEFVLGVLLLFSSRLIAGELAEDPQDAFVHWLIHTAHFDISSSVQLGIIVCALGLAKILLAFGLWYQSILVRHLGLIFFSGIAVFGAYHLYHNPSLFEAAALVIDVFIVYYFWKILPKHLRHKKST